MKHIGKKAIAVAMAALALLALAAIACETPEPVVQTVEVVRTVVVTEQVEVTKEVPVEVVRTVEVTKEVEVPVEIVRTVEVTKEVEVPVDVVRTVEVVKEVEVTKEVVKEVPVEVMVMPTPGPKGTIIFSDLNWSSAQVQNRIAQYLVEKGYEYPTEVVFGATLPLFQGLRNGDSHVTLEIWLPNQDEVWDEALAAGEVVSVGESLGKDWQSAFVIPRYLQEQYPDLDSVEDLKDDQFKALFATAETGGKALLVSCVIGWACEEVNAAQIEGYGLADHVHVLNPGDGAAANASLYGAYEREEPWLGYQWGTNDPALVLDLTTLEEPPYSDECWFTTKACAYEDASILIAVHPDLTTRAPDVVAMLRNWDFNISVYGTVAAWQRDNSDATPEDAALWWLKGNADTWGSWVTPDAKAGIQAALDANETPDGWPTS